MSGSIEQEAARQLRRAAFWRFVTAIIDLPGNLLNSLAGLLHRAADLFGEASTATFYFELDAARKYKNLTGVDLGFASKGDIERYAGTNPKVLARAEKDNEEDDDDDS
ncbi:MAG: hypothetical protein H0U53_11130 [Actinobacteria bacterium]|nr:hypothetical protein [Actinomycetota bacterium]